MIRFIIVAITVIGFLILSIPILLIEWIIGKFSPRTKEISSLRIVQGVFKFILWEEVILTSCLLTAAVRSVPATLPRKKWSVIRFFPTG